MRTTLTLEPDVEKGLRDLSRLRNEPFRRVVNELLRAALTMEKNTVRQKRRKVRISPHSGGFRPGVDVLKLHQLADELESDEFISEAATTSQAGAQSDDGCASRSHRHRKSV